MADQAGLEVADDRAQEPRCEKTRSEGTGCVLPNGREQTQGLPRRRGNMTKLPGDLVSHSPWPIAGGQANRLGGVGGGAQGVGAHVWDRRGLTSRSRGGRRGGRAHLAGRATIDEAAPYRFRDVKLATSERPGTGDRLAGTAISWSRGLK